MKIMKAINWVPGGLMVVPLFIGMVINTFFPNLLKIGGFTEALSGAGYPTVLGMYLFTVGTKMTLRTAPRMLKRGLGIMAAKVGVAMAVALSVAKFLGGDAFGLSTLAILVALSDTNGGMFMALTSAMGDKEDVGTYVPQSIETGPFLTMLILVGAGLANIPWLSMVSVIAPIFVGAILGNLDDDLRDFFGSHEAIIVPFMAFTLGQTINLSNVVKGGAVQGVGLGVFVLVVTGLVCIFADRLLGGSGIAGCGGVEHSRQFGDGAQRHRHGRPDLCLDRADRDGAGGRLGHRHRGADAAADRLDVPAGPGPARAHRHG